MTEPYYQDCQSHGLGSAVADDRCLDRDEMCQQCDTVTECVPKRDDV